MEEDNPRHFWLRNMGSLCQKTIYNKRFGDGHGILDRYMYCSFSGEIHRLLIVDIEDVDIFSATDIKLR